MIVWVEYKDEDGTKKQNELQLSDSELSVLLSSSHVTFPDAINPGNTNSFLMAKGEIIESTFVNTSFTNNKPYLKLTVNIVEKPVEF